MATLARPSTLLMASPWWQARSRAERKALVAAMAGVAVLLVWLLLLRPMERDSELLGRQLASARATLVEATRQADDIATLARSTPLPASREARAELDAAMAKTGIKPIAVDRVDNQRWRVTLDAIGLDTLASVLTTLQRDAHLRAVELTATARVEPGYVRAEMTLAP
jgi:type II secretory pathway component PulM